MTFDYKQMLEDREAGLSHDILEWDQLTPANKRRIARVPDMEAEIIRLREYLETIAEWSEEVRIARAALKGDDQ